ncbi:tri7-like toxin biosynthesis protein [Lasius niger]|uniref:Tri7-like toxin biosynthesis protein n=1 Tax=Lasius niger TaxID=67767 RepID=A0A0J7JT23_LASNI|nr:tri7-like toxin biosynthesis protein [Lasius niger]
MCRLFDLEYDEHQAHATIADDATILVELSLAKRSQQDYARSKCGATTNLEAVLGSVRPDWPQMFSSDWMANSARLTRLWNRSNNEFLQWQYWKC